jgi:hypothetical protein
LQSLLWTNGIITNCGVDSLSSQIIPRQIRVNHSDGDLPHTARRAIIDKIHGPHWATFEEAHFSALKWDEITDFLKRSFPTGRASDPSDALWDNPNQVHHPENHEIFATVGTGGNKFIGHKAFFHPDSKPHNNSSGDWFPEK